MNEIDVEDEYKKNPEITREVIKEIMDWVNSEPHLPSLTEFQTLISYHANFLDILKTKKSIEAYFTYRTQFTDLFTQLDVKSPEIMKAFETMTLVVLPGTTSEGYRVIFWKFNDPNPANFDHVACSKVYAFFCTTLIFELGTCPGYIAVLDFNGLKFGHLLKVNLTCAMHGLKFIQEATPIRLKIVEHVHFPYEGPLSFVAPFIKKELLQMLKFRKHMRDADTFPLELLPSDYPEGKGPPLKELREKWINLILARREQFLNEEITQKSDESKRIKDKKSWFGLW